MPSRGYRDLKREQLAEDKQLDKHAYAVSMEHQARTKAAYGRELHLRYLVKIAVYIDRHGLSAHAAAKKIADEIGGNARLRHANHKNLYRKFQEAAALYRRLALASENPSDAAAREICEEMQLDTSRSDYRAQLLQWAHETLERRDVARALEAASTSEEEEEIKRLHRDIINHNFLVAMIIASSPIM